MNKLIKKFSTSLEKNISFAVVGGGPAGLYCTKKLLKLFDNIKIDVFEKLPIPFGLIRYGVAPDNQDLKKFQNELSLISSDSRFRFFGNIEIGKDIKVSELNEIYSGIIFSYGASGEHSLNIEGENIKGCYSGRDIANCYEKFDIDFFNQIKNVVIIGNGNVSLDVARIFSKRKELLAITDINSKAFKRISDNNIKSISIVARRGILQSAFSLKEIRDYSKLDNVEFFVVKEEIQNCLEEAKNLVNRAEKRKIEFLEKNFNVVENVAQLNKYLQTDSQKKRIIFRYLLSPIKVIGTTKIEKVEFQPNILKKFENVNVSVKNTSKDHEFIDCDILIRSIGYKSLQIDKDIPFDNHKFIIPNLNGGVIESESSPKREKGMYTAGWVKTGPKGLLANTISNCDETVDFISNEINSNILELKLDNGIENLIITKKLKYYTFDDWKKIDEYERREGEKIKKLREKIISSTDINKFLMKN